MYTKQRYKEMVEIFKFTRLFSRPKQNQRLLYKKIIVIPGAKPKWLEMVLPVIKYYVTDVHMKGY